MGGAGTTSDETRPSLGDTPTRAEPAPPDPRDDQPLRIGRYAVLRTLGRGGMGVVYAAFDVELDRRIALKLLSTSTGEGSLGKARMRREAQALARLSHPNVVQVYEVGDQDGRLYLAMEFVDGPDLKGWLAATPRRWRQVLDVCVQAGHGLAAAHAAGLVHRDVKPANIIVGDDGRVRVIDFGLARADLDADPTVSIGGKPVVSESSSLIDALTQAGTLLGTPAYMAPEQLFRRPADARSDLFSFCVTVWEALHGQRPFVAQTVDELRIHIARGPPPPSGRIPAAVHRVLARGLAADPDERPPGMGPLLAALARAADARRRLFLSLGAGAAVAAATTAGYLFAAGPPRSDCAAAADLSDVFDADARAAVESAIRATGLAYAADTWAAVAPRLDTYAAELANLRQHSCLARHAAGPALSPALAEQTLCLERRRLELAAAVGVLRRADAGAVTGAVEAVAALAPLAPCRDLEALAARFSDGGPARDPAAEAAVAEAWRLLAEARTEMHAEHFERGLTVIGEALALAERLGDDRLLAAVLHRAALLREGSGDADAARRLAHRAYATAEAAADDTVVLDVATALVRLEGGELRDLTAARVWGEVATAKLARLPADDARRVRLLLESGVALIEGGDQPGGVPLIRDAVALAEKIRAAEPRLHISALNIQASGVLKRTGDLPTAEVLATRLVDLGAEVYGRDHPYNGMLIYNLGAIQYMRARHEPALRNFERSLALREAAYGPNHPEVAQSLNGLAAALGDLGRHPEAIAAAQRSLAIEAARRGEDHPELVFPLNNLATLLLQAGRPDEAAPHVERARAILEARGLREHVLAALVDETLANLALARHHTDEALDLLTRARATLERQLGQDHPDVGHLHVALAAVLLDLARHDEARAHLDRADTILTAAPDATRDRARARELRARLPPTPAGP